MLEFPELRQVAGHRSVLPGLQLRLPHFLRAPRGSRSPAEAGPPRRAAEDVPRDDALRGGGVLRVPGPGLSVRGVFQRGSPRGAADGGAEPAGGVVGVCDDLRAGGGVVSVHDAGVRGDGGGAAGERMWARGEGLRRRPGRAQGLLREGLEAAGHPRGAGRTAQRDHLRGALLQRHLQL